jgi:hypothetical protein
MKLTAIIVLVSALALSGGVIWVQHSLAAKDKEIASQARQARVNLAALQRVAREKATVDESLRIANAANVIDTRYVTTVVTIREKAQEVKNDIPKAETCEGLADIVRAHHDGLERMRND